MIASAKKQGFTVPVLTNRTGTGKWTAGDVFDNVQSNFYWSGSTYSSNTTYAWVVSMYDGNVYDGFKAIGNYVWPVRAGQ